MSTEDKKLLNSEIKTEDNKLFCVGCENYTDKLYHDYRYDLCFECNEKYDDKTGYCSLFCCINNQCDDSC